MDHTGAESLLKWTEAGGVDQDAGVGRVRAARSGIYLEVGLANGFDVGSEKRDDPRMKPVSLA